MILTLLKMVSMSLKRLEDPDSGRMVTVDPVGEYESAFNNAEGGYIRGIELRLYASIFIPT